MHVTDLERQRPPGSNSAAGHPHHPNWTTELSWPTASFSDVDLLDLVSLLANWVGPFRPRSCPACFCSNQLFGPGLAPFASSLVFTLLIQKRGLRSPCRPPRLSYPVAEFMNFGPSDPLIFRFFFLSRLGLFEFLPRRPVAAW